MNASRQVQQLLDRGAVIQAPSSVYIDPSVEIARISPDIIIHPGCRITGHATSIGPGCNIGGDGPVTIADCRLAEKVSLKGGSFSGSVMMAGVTCGPCAHLRDGTLLEEQSSCAHSAGLKQTILMPYVTLGSLVNFCDCLMAGGTDRKNHSEVGSSYVHFNYTPHQDKATASLIGDVPRGVMLDQKPVFLGGQGGLLGPARIEYGTTVAAGVICRKDVLSQNKLVFGSGPRIAGESAYDPEIYGDISRTLTNNFIYIGNLHALHHWYSHFRSLFIAGNHFNRACHEGAVNVLHAILKERIKHLDKLADNLGLSLEAARRKHGKNLPDYPYALHRKFLKQWPKLRSHLEYGANSGAAAKLRKKFSGSLGGKLKPSYIETVKNLRPETRKIGTLWLQSVVDSITAMRIS